MQTFNFQFTDSLQSAVSKHQSLPSSKFLAGGTTLVDLLKLHVETPENLIDISSLKLKDIHDQTASLHVGALVTNAELAADPKVQKYFPVLSQAILSGASPQLRNLATTSGNLLQRTRCPYFRDTSCACNKREPGTGCSAYDGVNRNLAILGVSNSCIATNPSDMNVALMALGAIVHTNERTIKIEDFFVVPGKTPEIETSLKTHELITAVEIPKQKWFAKSVYVKVRDRASYSFALTSAAVALDIVGGVVKESRIALGGVGTIPWRSREAENALRGKTLSITTIQDASEAALATAEARPQNKFKIKLAESTLVSALKKCGGIA